ncbi:protein of unknown function [Paraburkholderia kururiensis]
MIESLAPFVAHGDEGLPEENELDHLGGRGALHRRDAIHARVRKNTRVESGGLFGFG